MNKRFLLETLYPKRETYFAVLLVMSIIIFYAFISIDIQMGIMGMVIVIQTVISLLSTKGLHRLSIWGLVSEICFTIGMTIIVRLLKCGVVYLTLTLLVFSIVAASLPVKKRKSIVKAKTAIFFWLGIIPIILTLQ